MIRLTPYAGFVIRIGPWRIDVRRWFKAWRRGW